MSKKEANRASVFFFVLCLLLCGIVWGGGLFSGNDSAEERVHAFPVANESTRKSLSAGSKPFPPMEKTHTKSFGLQENYNKSVYDGVLPLEETRQGYATPYVLQEKPRALGQGHAMIQTSSVRAVSYAGGVAAQPQTISHTAVQPNGGGHTFLALAAPVRRSSVAFETGEVAIGAETVHGGKRYGPNGGGMGDDKSDKDNTSTIEDPTPLPDAIGFVLLLAGAYALKGRLKMRGSEKCITDVFL